MNLVYNFEFLYPHLSNIHMDRIGKVNRNDACTVHDNKTDLFKTQRHLPDMYKP